MLPAAACETRKGLQDLGLLGFLLIIEHAFVTGLLPGAGCRARRLQRRRGSSITDQRSGAIFAEQRPWLWQRRFAERDGERLLRRGARSSQQIGRAHV